ncbi:MAG TPA: ubiquitin-like protein [Luteibacter sp.]|uniref:ubiquitin-like protein n=1 Tax=Luteibacter sp. TaxID=1886636 RepID=UPI002B95D82A|nr:ubiquitin-like protein [Luteibacter sp.]HVI54226.1 ubiquitin-like protein [Luteibacter sp.]
MKIQVNAVGGDQTILQVDPDESVDDLKARLQDVKGHYPDDQTLVFAGRNLEGGKSLADYNITEGSTVKLVLKSN